MTQADREPEAPAPAPDGPATGDPGEQDVEGSSMAVAEMGRTVARERQVQAERAARDVSRHGKVQGKSLIDRLFGR
jgi:hypothetical protein